MMLVPIVRKMNKTSSNLVFQLLVSGGKTTGQCSQELNCLGWCIQGHISMGPIEHPHRHQTLEDWIIPVTSCPIDSLFLTDADHVAPEDVVIGKTFQGVVMLMTLLKMFSPCHDNTMTHSLRDLGSLGQQHQHADVKVGCTI